MAILLKEQDVKPYLKWAMPSTKKLILAGINGSDEFPKLFAEYKWPGTRSVNMSLIILAFVNYCRIKRINIFDETDVIYTSHGFSAHALKKNELALEKVLEPVFPKTKTHEFKAKRDKVIKDFIKQSDIIKYKSISEYNIYRLEELLYKTAKFDEDNIKFPDRRLAYKESLKDMDDIIKAKDTTKFKNFLEGPGKEYMISLIWRHEFFEKIIDSGCAKPFIQILRNYINVSNFLGGSPFNVGLNRTFIMNDIIRAIKYAIDKNCDDLVKYLLDLLGNSNYNSCDNAIDLIKYAVKKDHLDTARYILNKVPFSYDYINLYSHESQRCLLTIIRSAFKHNYLDLLKLIVEEKF